MKKIVALAALAAAALTLAGAAPASAAALPSKGELVLCSLNLSYATSGSVASAAGSGTCTGLLQLQRYTATASAVWGGSGCPPTTLPLQLTLTATDGATKVVPVAWSPSTLGLLANVIGMPIQLGPLSGPGLLGLGVGGGSTNCVVPSGNSGTMQSNATFLFTSP